MPIKLAKCEDQYRKFPELDRSEVLKLQEWNKSQGTFRDITGKFRCAIRDSFRVFSLSIALVRVGSHHFPARLLLQNRRGEGFIGKIPYDASSISRIVLQPRRFRQRRRQPAETIVSQTSNYSEWFCKILAFVSGADWLPVIYFQHLCSAAEFNKRWTPHYSEPARRFRCVEIQFHCSHEIDQYDHRHDDLGGGMRPWIRDRRGQQGADILSHGQIQYGREQEIHGLLAGELGSPHATSSLIFCLLCRKLSRFVWSPYISSTCFPWWTNWWRCWSHLSRRK